MKTVRGENVIFYLNGMFSIPFFFLPLVFARRNKCHVVICPRGMLQEGALSHGSFKKKSYLWC
ncbi:MAG TPA: hypothetical protein VG737_07915, partial [Cyclobacteriaceae bacterium]|nr:hypothetical protein [Cyclobacteriaceae bacterium]